MESQEPETAPGYIDNEYKTIYYLTGAAPYTTESGGELHAEVPELLHRLHIPRLLAHLVHVAVAQVPPWHALHARVQHDVARGRRSLFQTGHKPEG